MASARRESAPSLPQSKEPDSWRAEPRKIALLLSTQSFEGFFGKTLNLTPEAYVRSYRNDWSWAYAKGLLSFGIETTIYIPSFQELPLFVAEKGICVRFLPFSKHARTWQLLERAFKTPLGRYLYEHINARLFYGSLRQALQQDEIDLLYIQEYWTGRFDFLVQHLDLPIIAGDHGGQSYKQIAWFKRNTFARASQLTSQTPAEQAEVARYGTDALLLTNAVDTAFYTPSPRAVTGAKTILVVARFNESQKRLTDLIRALTQLDETWHLNIAGTGPDEVSYKKLVETLGLAHRVTFLGFVKDPTTLRSHYRRCGVFVLPSAWEGLPLVVLEAMSSGAAIVVTNLRAYEHFVEDGKNGVVVQTGDVKGLAAGILRAFANRTRLGQAARQTVQDQFSNEAIYGRLTQLIRQCTPGSSVTPNPLLSEQVQA